MAPASKEGGTIGRKLGFAAVTVCLVLLLLEGGARLALLLTGPEQAPLLVGRDRRRSPLFQSDPELFFRLRPGLDAPERRNPRMIDVRTNSLGLRGPEIAATKADGTLRVLALGDSCTFGSAARTDQTFPWQLQERLADGRTDPAVEVINAGVPGYTSYQGLAYLVRDGLRLAPDVVVITFGFNDAAPAEQGISDREYAALTRRAGRLGLTRLLARWRRARASAGDTTRTSSGSNRVTTAEYADNLRAMLAACRAHGARPLIVVWPMRAQAGVGSLDRGADVEANQRVAREIARSEDVPLVDLVAPVEGRPELFFDQIHMTPDGYGLVAERIAAELRRHPPFGP